MRLIEKIYSDFFVMLEEEKIYLNPDKDFDGICRELEISPEEFNEFLMDELGFTGEEILAKYRNCK